MWLYEEEGRLRGYSKECSNSPSPPICRIPMATAAEGTAPITQQEELSQRANEPQPHLLLHINPPLPHSSLSANHFLHLPFIFFFIKPFIPAHSVHTFTAEWFNPFLLIIYRSHSSSWYVHIFTCLFSARSIINLSSFCECELIPNTP